MPPVLGYWKIRGFAQSIKFMLEFAGEEYEEKFYSLGPAPDYSRDQWLDEKYKLDLPFPNLPYYIDGDVKLTQSIVIMRYLARKLNLDAGEENRVKADLIEQQGIDLRMAFVKLAYNPDFEKLLPGFLKTLPQEFKNFSKFLGKNKWFAGDKITYVDFLLYEAIDVHKALSADCLKDFPNLEAYLKRFEKLPAIEKYMSSDKFIKWPICNDHSPLSIKTKPAE